MKKSRVICYLWLAFTLILTLSPLTDIRPLFADPGKLIWDILNTPSKLGNVIVSPSEINALAIGSDGKTFYAIDIPGDLAGVYANGKIYKSTDAGVTWRDIFTNNLLNAGATLPVWDIAIAPDDPNFIAVVTDSRQEVYMSVDGGNNWSDTDASTYVGGLFISDIAISPLRSDGYRDIAFGTRDPTTNVAPFGQVFIRQYPIATWLNSLAPAQDIISLAFSPSYDADRTLLVVSSDATSTYLHFGTELTTATPVWDWFLPTGYVTLDTTVAQDEIIWSDIELPSDYDSGNHGTGTPPKIYVSYDYDGATRQGKICRIDDLAPYFITPPGMGNTGVSSIAYYGNVDGGKLFAAEAIPSLPTVADPYQVKIWRTFNPTGTPPTWDSPFNRKQPTGGAVSGYANAQIAFSPDGGTVYCGTGTATVNSAAHWATAANWITETPWDESAFSVSQDDAEIWNQISLIDTGLIDPTPPPDKLFLTDAAITTDSETIYLASVNKNTNCCDSIWRSTSKKLGTTWERVLCFKTELDDAEIILRLNPRIKDTKLIFLAVPGTDMVWYSRNQGQLWYDSLAPADVIDLTLASETTVYLLDGLFVHRGVAKGGGIGWTWGQKVGTCLNSGHTIATPLQNPENEEWVIVGEGDPGLGRVAYANFLAKKIEFERTIGVPVPGKMHVLCDDKFRFNKTIYAASDDKNGRIYRWVLKVSESWQELEPPNREFYGLAQQNDVLYGAWRDIFAISNTHSGVDRTLHPTAFVPPPLDWDDLTAGLPETGDTNFPVWFTREPSSLKSSANTDIYLWAIDNHPYNFADKKGCLWIFTDLLAVAGPWALSPAPGEVIPVDPVSGRSAEVNFRWRQFPETRKYEFWLAKDEGFTQTVIRIPPLPTLDGYEPYDLEAPAYILLPGCCDPYGIEAPALEANHDYYWKVRAIEVMNGEKIRSQWSATMFFTTEPGLPVTARYIGPMALAPTSGTTGVPIKPLSFSWTRFQDTTEYQFQLASDPGMTEILVDTKVPTTAYSYDQELEYSTNYFWRVRATQPYPSDWSPVFSFQTVAEPVSPLPEKAPTAPPTPVWVWFLIAVVALLYLGIITLVTAKPRYVKPAPAKDMISGAVLGSKNPIGKIIDSIVAKLRGSGITTKPRYVKPAPAKDMISGAILGTKNPIGKIIDSIVKKLRGNFITTKPRYVKPRPDKNMLSGTIFREGNPLTRIKKFISMKLRKRRHLL